MEDFVSTYATTIANGTLSQFGIKMNPDELSDQLHHANYFYKYLFRPQSSRYLNEIYLQQLQDLCNEAEEKLSRLIYASERPGPIQTEINHLKEQLAKHTAQLNEDLTQQKARNHHLQEEAKKQMEVWHQLQEKHAAQIVVKLTEAGVTLPPTFMEHLMKQLLLQGAGVTVPQNLLSMLKLPSQSQKAMLAAIKEINQDVQEILKMLNSELWEIDKENQNFIKKEINGLDLIHQKNKGLLNKLKQKGSSSLSPLIASIKLLISRLSRGTQGGNIATEVSPSKPTPP